MKRIARTFAAASTIALLFAGGGHNDTPRSVTAESGKAGQLAKSADGAQQSSQVNSDKLQLVAGITGPMPTGIAVSKSGRVFVNFPRWGDPVEYTVAELKDGKAVPYPNLEMNKAEGDPATNLIGVQSVVIDDQDR